MHRTRRLAALVLMLAPWCAIACATHRAEHRELESVWRDYRALPDQRALAIAGVIERNRFVAGASGGHASSDAARAGALRECQLRRQRMRMQHPCRLYAVGDEVVWGDVGSAPQPPAR